jgi:hypothetical protein
MGSRRSGSEGSQGYLRWCFLVISGVSSPLKHVKSSIVGAFLLPGFL